MSYDLYLSSPSLTLESFSGYFSGRRSYEEPGWYVNEDTGVYFSFAFSETGEDDPEAPGAMQSRHVAFNLNYFRPHVFGLEAEPEVAAFVAAFNCALHDPQLEGMGDGPYSREGFLRGWNAGNAFGYRAIGDKIDPATVLTVEDSAIEAVWRWNAGLSRLNETSSELHFLPRVSWSRDQSGQPISYVVWGEGVAVAIPSCATHALLAREHRATLFGRKSGLEAKLMRLDEVARLGGCAWTETEGGRLLLAPTKLPPGPSVLDAFKNGFRSLDELPRPVSMDHVLDASLVAKS